MIRGLTRRSFLAGLLAGPRPTTVAFHYAAIFSPREIRWYTRFGILVTGAILPPKQTAALRAGGSQLIAYEWSSGFYPRDWVSAAESWQRRVRPEWTITPKPVGGAAAEPGKTAHWYDFGNPELVTARARYLAGLLVSSRYDGFFFDTLGFEQVPAPAQEAFRKKHPDLDYNECQGKFLAELRQCLPPGKLIFTNQAYRHAEFLLPNADLDLTESTFTYINGRQTAFRPWHDPAKPWESIRTPMLELIGAAQKKFPNVRFVHANYAADAYHDAAVYSYAAAKLFGHESYLIVPSSAQGEEDPIYATSLGRPLTDTFQEDLAAGAAWRQYENGYAAILSGPEPFTIPETSLRMNTSSCGYIFNSH